LVYCDPLPRVESSSAGAASILTEETFTAQILDIPAAQADRYAVLARARYQRYRHDLGRPRFRLLEIGCGAAGLAPVLTALGVDYHGIDIDHRPIEAARARGITGLRVGDFFELPSDGPFDVIALSQVLEHITRPRELMHRIRQSLTPDGILHVDVPNHAALAGLPSRAVGGLGRRLGAIEWPHHSIAYRTASLSRLVSPHFGSTVVFTAAPDHDVWGQAVVPSVAARIYYRASRLLQARSLLVAYGHGPAGHTPARDDRSPGRQAEHIGRGLGDPR
jgi:SAM-dependent methyltransferase